ncbi:MAG: NTP transferase domain-containing protein [Nitrospinae bacterium]|nr:NTP transferase domain-containing protein [Nitrospinota bacterium]
MEAVILLAGYGSRLNRQDIPHKSLLPFGNDTLLSRHLSCLQELGIDRTHLVLGHNKEKVENYVRTLQLGLPIQFIDNKVYRTTGNTLSMVMGLRQCAGDVLILDGDVLYPRRVFMDYARQSDASSFAMTPGNIDDEESAKVLLKPSGVIHAFITKRRLTEAEKNGFKFGGEAIGFFKLSAQNVKKFLDLYAKEEAEYEKVLWEIPFTEFAQQADLKTWTTANTDCFEIDTQEEYQHALAHFERNRDIYG